MAALTQTLVTLVAGTAADAHVPSLGASGAIAAVLGAYYVLYPDTKVLTFWWSSSWSGSPAWVFLGLWFLFQLFEGNFGLLTATAHGGGTAVLRPHRRLRVRAGS